jgi:Family of unknown function (DUF6084)
MAVPSLTSAAPELAFTVTDAGPLIPAAVPTLRFGLRIETGDDALVRSIMLQTQIQIAARRRRHGAGEEERLFDLFGAPRDWATTLRTLPWLRQTQVVPQFAGAVDVDLEVPCTYDFEVAATRYLQALDGGEVPLELLFSGTLFYSTEAGLLQTAQLPASAEADYRMPVAAWRETMDRHFPGAVWLRLEGKAFERLHAYRSGHALPSWEATIDHLLGHG